MAGQLVPTYMTLTGVSSQAFTPLSLSPLAWYDAQSPGSLFQDSAATTPATANNDPVGHWKDLSGNARNLVQATSGKRPLLKTSQYNGKPYVKGDAVDDYLRYITSAFITNASEVWMLAYPTLTAFPGPGSYLYPCWGQGTSQFPPCQQEYYNGFGSTGQNALYGEGVGTQYIDGAAYGGGAVTGGQGYRTSGICTGSSGAVTNTGFHVFSLDPSGGTIYYSPEAISVMIVLPAATSAAQRALMDAYFAAKQAA